MKRCKLILLLLFLFGFFLPSAIGSHETIESNTTRISTKTESLQSYYETIINGDFETGTTEGWDLRYIDLGPITNTYGISGTQTHDSSQYAYHLNTTGYNDGTGTDEGEIYIGQNFTVYNIKDYNLTGWVFVDQCLSDEYGSWAGIYITFYNINNNELGQIYYQFANTSNLIKIYDHKINLYNTLDSWLKFNRNISKDFFDEFSTSPEVVSKIDLGFHVYANAGNSQYDQGVSEAYFDDWAFEQEYEDMNHISILRDIDLKIFPGDGSKETPYLIKGFNLNFDKANIIDIRNTRSYVTIDTNILNGNSGPHRGIYLNNATNITIVSNTIENCNTAIELWDSTNNTILLNSLTYNADGIRSTVTSNDNKILNNTVSKCSGSAITVDSSNGCLVQFNTVFSNDDNGISLDSSYYCTVYYNTIYNCSYQGIHLYECEHDIIQDNWVYNCSTGIRVRAYSLHNSIIGNIVYKNTGDGIVIEGASDLNIISENYIFDNHYSGLILESAFNNNVTWNTLVNQSNSAVIQLIASNYNWLANNTLYDNQQGLYLSGISGWNTLEWNDFIGNSIGGSQATDDNGSNLFQFNFYDEWVHPDDDSNGYVDSSYKIYGSGNNEDLFPQVRPSTTGLAPYLTRPMLIYPGNEPYMEIKGTATIDWADSEGCYDGSITYALYYKNPDEDEDWHQIISGITVSSFNWDTTTVPNGWNYELKVIAVSTCGLMATDFTDYNVQIDNEISATSTTEPTTEDGVTSGWSFALLLISLIAIHIRKRRKRG